MEEYKLKKLSILGATGSIGTQTLDVVRRQKDDFRIIGIAAKSNVEKTIDIIKEFKPEYAVLIENKAYTDVKAYCREKNLKIEVLEGIEGMNLIASLSEVDLVVTSLVGMVGLIPTLAAIKAGKDIALANKETLVVAGEIVMKEAKERNINIFPVDSEHGAVFQCLQGNSISDIEKILLTASGGPFRGRKRDFLEKVSLEEALHHPRWKMGKKISIDSATLMNKGLEVIEAHWLFDVDFEKIQVVIHPESIIHSMVEYIDGSILAQIASTDMRLPIQYALNYPFRKERIINRIDFYKLGKLTFEEPDLDTFKPLKLAFTAGKLGGTYPTILNAANEAAVDLLLESKIKFLDIGDIIEDCMNKVQALSTVTVESILQSDFEARNFVKNNFKKY
jgi:1-deoxy-D-xylulose-5-phosphate reductoisomerase